MGDDPRPSGASPSRAASNGSGGAFSFANEPRTPRLAWRYAARALRLRCPGCGTRPIFLPARRVRGLGDWFQPLDGCPRCGYAYEREDGYFLFAIFGINFGFAMAVAVVDYVLLDILEIFGPVPIWTLTLAVALPIPLVNFLVARHAKALWIALDQFFDPQLPPTPGDGGWWDLGPDDDPGDGNDPAPHDPLPGDPGQALSLPQTKATCKVRELTSV